MKKYKGLFIFVCVGLIIILGITIIFMKNKNNKLNIDIVETKESIENIVTDKEREEIKFKNIEDFVKLLSDSKIRLTNQTEIQSDEVDETGYQYRVDNETIQIFEIENLKLESMILNRVDMNRIRIKTYTGEKLEVPCFNNIIVLNCSEELKNKIINVIQPGGSGF